MKDTIENVFTIRISQPPTPSPSSFSHLRPHACQCFSPTLLSRCLLVFFRHQKMNLFSRQLSGLAQPGLGLENTKKNYAQNGLNVAFHCFTLFLTLCSDYKVIRIIANNHHLKESVLSNEYCRYVYTMSHCNTIATYPLLTSQAQNVAPLPNITSVLNLPLLRNHTPQD